MPSTSKAQQKFMGLVHAYKKGEVKGSEVSKAIKKAAKSMKKSSTKKYASTKHTDLPDKVKEDRDYKEEYKKYGSSTKSKKYRAELNQYNRKKGTYGNGDGKDASHKGGKIVGFESQSKNRGRAEKSRLKKEAVNEDGHTDVASAERKLKLIVKDAMDTINQLRNMSNEDSLPSWWTDKITLAKDYVSKSRDYITNPAESFEEGFGGDLKGEEKIKFEKARKSNGEQLGYKLSGTSDIKESVNEGKFNPNKIKIHTNKAIGYLKQAQKFAKEGQKGAVWQRIGDARDELKMTDKFLESVNEIFPKGAGRKISKAMQKGNYKPEKRRKLKTGEVEVMKGKGSRQKWFYLKNKEEVKQLIKLGRNSAFPTGITNNNSRVKFDKGLHIKESVNESIQLPHGMKLGKVFTGHGKSFVKIKESLPTKITDKFKKLKDEPEGDFGKDFSQHHKSSMGDDMGSSAEHDTYDFDDGGDEKPGNKTEKDKKKIGYEPVTETVEPVGNMAKIQKIVKDKQATKLGGVMVDMQSASLLMKLYDKVSDKDKERMNKFPAKKLTLVIKRLWDRINLKLPL